MGTNEMTQQQYGQVDLHAGQGGTVRPTGKCVLLGVVTLGIYPLVWYFKTFSELRRHNGTGLSTGLVIAMVVTILPMIAFPFLCGDQVDKMYRRRGDQPPITAATGCWSLIPYVGIVVWWVKANRAINDYWASGSTG